MSNKIIAGTWIGLFLFYCFAFFVVHLIDTVTIKNNEILYYWIPFQMTETDHFGKFLVSFLVGFFIVQFFKPPTDMNDLWPIVLCIPIILGIGATILEPGLTVLSVVICFMALVFTLAVFTISQGDAPNSGLKIKPFVGIATATIFLIPCSIFIAYLSQSVAFVLLGFLIGAGVIVSINLMSFGSMFFAIIIASVCSTITFFVFDKENVSKVSAVSIIDGQSRSIMRFGRLEPIPPIPEPEVIPTPEPEPLNQEEKEQEHEEEEHEEEEHEEEEQQEEEVREEIRRPTVSVPRFNLDDFDRLHRASRDLGGFEHRGHRWRIDLETVTEKHWRLYRDGREYLRVPHEDRHWGISGARPGEWMWGGHRGKIIRAINGTSG